MDAAEIFSALLTPEGRADPYPLYSALHELGTAAPIDGAVLVPGYDAINSVLRDPAFRVDDAAFFDLTQPDWRDHPALSMESMLSLNQPEHPRIRSLVSKAFTARRIATLQPAIAAMTDQLIDALAERGSCGGDIEFMHEFAFLLPVTVICELIGIAEQDRELFRPIATALVATLEPFIGPEDLAAADKAAVQLNEYLTMLAAQRRECPRDDLMSAMVGIRDAADGRLTDSELLDNVGLLLIAGFETTANLLGNGLAVILADPDLGRALRDGSVPVAAFVEEVLRFDSPVQMTSRRNPEPCEIGGLSIRPNDTIVAMLGAANRDPRKFAAPDSFDASRYDGVPLSFGGGAHFCLGAALARLEAAVAFPRLLARFPALRLAGAPRRKQGIVLRGFAELPVSLGYAAG
jgi:cytochrome P450